MLDDVAALVGSSLRDGRYAVTAVLGHGSQGATFEAVDKRDGRLVAIKRFQVRGARSWKEVELAEREAKVLGEIEHRLVPRVVEHFEEDGALHLVMEKIEGPTLAELGRVDRDEVVRFLRDAGEVLAHLHSRAPPVIHRDIKPRNVIRRPPREGERDSSYVLVDFGSVRAHLEPKGGSTVVGTFGYMAPEQLQGRALPATDVYGVGVTALVLLTGIEPEELPHRGLGIDVEAALGERGTPLARALATMVDPDPDRRASRIAPLLRDLETPMPRPTKQRERPTKQRPTKQRRAKRRERRRARSRPTDWERIEAWPPLPRALAALALSIASLAVALSLRFAVPTLLAVLSIAFGPALRRAARNVDAAGRRALLAIGRARRRVRGLPARIEQPPAQARIEEPPPQETLRNTLSEIEREMEEAVDEVEREFEAQRRRPPR